jgi:hypothetical protein
MDVRRLRQVGGQAGYHPGGYFLDDNGVYWYIKRPASELHVRNEKLGNELYALLGIPVPDTSYATWLDEAPALASKLVWPVEQGEVALRAAAKARVFGLAEGFGADAWLANWDVVGEEFANMVLHTHAGQTVAWRLDCGGCMLFHGSGEPKDSHFGPTVHELTRMRRPESLFASLEPPQLRASIERVLALEATVIAERVRLHGFDGALAALLEARRDDLRAQMASL